MKSYDIEHVTSSPHYPQSNGKVENAIRTAKNLLKKSKAAGTDFYLALLAWRNTPSEGLESSPAQRMFGRRTRTLIPMTSELLKPKIVEDVQGKLMKRKQLQAKHYNISAKELPPLSKGEIVRVKPTDRSRRWFKARVEQQVDVRSYEVRTEDGRSSGETEDTSEAVRNQHVLESTLSPSRCRIRLTCQKVSPSPNLVSLLRKPVPLWRYHRLRNLRAVPRLLKSSPPKPVDCPVTRSGRMSRPPSYLKDFVVAK